MALEACFQVSTITAPTTTKASYLSSHPFPHKEKLYFTSKRSIPSISVSTSSSLRSLRRGRSVACKAKNTVDGGKNHVFCIFLCLAKTRERWKMNSYYSTFFPFKTNRFQNQGLEFDASKECLPKMKCAHLI